MRRDRDAEAVVAPFLPLAHLRVFLRVEEARMRIERGEHAADGAVDQAVGLDLVDVARFDGAQRGGERAGSAREPCRRSRARFGRRSRRPARTAATAKTTAGKGR